MGFKTPTGFYVVALFVTTVLAFYSQDPQLAQFCTRTLLGVFGGAG